MKTSLIYNKKTNQIQKAEQSINDYGHVVWKALSGKLGTFADKSVIQLPSI